MDLYRGAERLMAMDDATWRRHANPLSGWTRLLTVVPLLSLAIWSRAWIGGWAILPVAAALAWVWINPRAFAAPARFDAWMSRGVLGERVWIEHRDAVAPHHRRAANLLAWASLPGALVWLWGLWALWWEGVVFGGALMVLPKLWFVDRMVWVLQDWRQDGREVPGVDTHEL